MNHLLARLKGRNAEIWKVMSQQGDLFALPDLSQTHIFEASYKLEDGEWYRLEQFNTLNFQNPLVGSSLNTTNYVQLAEDSYKDIEYFCCVQQGSYFFQKVTASQIIKKPWFTISGAPTVHQNEPIMCLSFRIDAIYQQTTDTLYFRDISKITNFFQGIENLYREATQQEVDDFLDNNSFISLNGNYSSSAIGSNNRKRIALVVDKISNLSAQEKQSMFSYIQSYCPHLQLTSNNQGFVISKERHLTDILFGIDERYHTTSLSQEKRLANSVKKIVGTP